MLFTRVWMVSVFMFVCDVWCVVCHLGVFLLVRSPLVAPISHCYRFSSTLSPTLPPSLASPAWNATARTRTKI